MAAVMLASIAAGCNKEDDDPYAPEIPEFIYTPDYIKLPEGIDDIQNLTYADGKFYFTSYESGMDDDGSWYHRTTLNSMNIDGTDLRRMDNYKAGEPPVEGAQGSTWINSLRVDGDGGIWVGESGNFWFYNLLDDYDPEFDGWEWEYYEDLGNVVMVRKLDETGAELFSVDISGLSAGMDYFYMQTFNIDKDDNIFVGANDTIFVMEKDGRLMFKIELTNGYVDQLVRLADGSIAYFGWMETGRSLRKIDLVTRGWGDEVELPFNAYNVYPGGGEYDIIFSDNVNLYGVETETGEIVKMLNWINSDIILNDIDNLTILPDGRVMLVTRSWNRGPSMEYNVEFELIVLTKVPYESVPEKTIIVMATMDLDWNLRTAIVNFNRNNDQYRIQVNDYAEFRTEDDWQAGLTKLTTEIVSGRIPDILDTQQLPIKQYVAKGLLEDLYPFIDSDARLSRSDLMEGVFKAAEMDGGLYQIFWNFQIATLMGDAKILGPEPGWTMDEFRAVLRANPNADVPLGQWNTKMNFLSQAVMVNIDQYVDWVNGKCDFANETFAGLLEFANTFPEEFKYDYDNYIDESELIATGRQIMANTSLYNFRSYTMYNAMFGGDLVFKGFPTDSLNGNSIQFYSGLAMTTKCRDKEGAWQFMRTVLTEDWQRNNVWGFGTNKNLFYEMLEEEMTPYTYIDHEGNEVESSKGSMGWGDFMVEIWAMTQEEADQILNLINSVVGTYSQDQVLSEIISEGAADFFSGRNSAQDAARVIQSRASIYIAEQS